MSGWIKSHRTILEHELLANDNNAYITFTKLLLKVDHKRGQYITGRFKLSELTNLKPTTAWAALQRLKNHKMVTLVSDNQKTVVHICNWHKYQSTHDSDHDNQMTTRRQPDDTKQEVRNKNKENTNVLAKANYGNPLVNKMFDLWLKELGYPITSKLQANRRACNNLVRKHGEAGLEKLIKGVAMAANDQYGPRIADFSDLQAKFNALILWGKKQSNNKIGVIK